MLLYFAKNDIFLRIWRDIIKPLITLIYTNFLITRIFYFSYSVTLLFSYSLFKASTGFAVAAFTACQHTVSKAIPIVKTATAAKSHHGISVR